MAIIKKHSFKTGTQKPKQKTELQDEVAEVEVAVKPEVVEEQVEDIDLFDLDNIDFSQRQERRRGYRRIDDRNLISRAQEEANMIKENAAKEGYKTGLENAQSDITNLRESLNSFLNAKQEVFDEVARQV